jgi:hypothetical protein
MKNEIVRFQDVVGALVDILKKDESLTMREEETIGSEIGRLRSELGLWKKRKKSK